MTTRWGGLQPSLELGENCSQKGGVACCSKILTIKLGQVFGALFLGNLCVWQLWHSTLWRLLKLCRKRGRCWRALAKVVAGGRVKAFGATAVKQFSTVGATLVPFLYSGCYVGTLLKQLGWRPSGPGGQIWSQLSNSAIFDLNVVLFFSSTSVVVEAVEVLRSQSRSVWQKVFINNNFITMQSIQPCSASSF